MTAPDRTIDWLRDREELRALPQRYARAIDGRDIDSVAALLHPEGTVDGARGLASVADYVDMLRGAAPTFASTMHVLGDPLITLEPAADTGQMDTYAIVYQLDRLGGDGGDMTLGVRYIDEVVRHDGHWLIRHRQARILWNRAVPGRGPS